MPPLQGEVSPKGPEGSFRQFQACSERPFPYKNASLGQREVAERSEAGGIVNNNKNNPSVSLTADSSLYTREPVRSFGYGL